MKLLAAEGLMYDPGLIECAEFDWFSVSMSRGRSVLYLTYQTTATSLSLVELSMFIVCAEWFLSFVTEKQPPALKWTCCLCWVVVEALCFGWLPEINSVRPLLLSLKFFETIKLLLLKPFMQEERRRKCQGFTSTCSPFHCGPLEHFYEMA